MEDLTRYSYRPLTTANSIRMITLLPGIGHQQLNCTLKEVALDESPQYEAISYVWGDETTPASIVCDDFGHSLPITQNLAAALFRFRLVDQQRVLWADAICINQEDIAERGHQVRLMGEVYGKASGVLVWLGEEDENTELVSTCLHSSFIELTDTETRALKLFFERPWFHRAWTFQESVLAQSAQVHCGSYRFSKQLIHDAIQGLSWATEAGIVEPELDRNLRVSRVMMRPESSHAYDRSIGEFLMLRRGSQCKDPRDLVYSLLGVARGIEGIEPDYSRSMQDIFTSTTRRIITSTRSLSLLEEINTQNFDAALPSWVPDWREKKLETVFSRRLKDWAGAVDAGGGAQMAPFQQNRIKHTTQLSVRGLCADEIGDLVEGEDLDGFFGLFHGEKNDSTTSYSIELAFLRTMALDYYFYPDAHGSRKRKGRWKYNFEPQDPYDISYHNNYVDLFGENIKGQNLFRTKDGFMGLGPRRSQRGDLVCIICGVESPVLLRPSGNEYLFVGHCYVYGLMEGRALLCRARMKTKRSHSGHEDDGDVNWLWNPPVASEMQEFVLK
jgi:hypothetical protein